MSDTTRCDYLFIICSTTSFAVEFITNFEEQSGGSAPLFVTKAERYLRNIRYTLPSIVYYTPFKIIVNTSRVIAVWYHLKMNKADDYIIVTDGRNLDEDGASSEEVSSPQKEKESREAKELSLRALRMQGIFPEHEEGEGAPPTAAQDEFSKELFRESGIEILKEEGEDEVLG